MNASRERPIIPGAPDTAPIMGVYPNLADHHRSVLSEPGMDVVLHVSSDRRLSLGVRHYPPRFEREGAEGLRFLTFA